jgi:mRNA interferase MazF
VRRGEVFVAELSPRSGSEQRGIRPVIVVSHDAFNEVAGWRSIIVVPVSSSGRQAARGPTAVSIETGVSGLTRKSVALCHQVTTLDRSKLTRRLGTLPPRDAARVDQGLKAALNLL